MSAKVVTTGFANKSVKWTSSEDTIKVDEFGTVKIPANTELTEVTITATSIYDDSVRGTAKITIV